MIAHSHLITLFQALNAAAAKYVVVGGLAVNLHGHQRFTKDVDLLISLENEELTRFVQVLSELGFKPIYPIDLEEFLDAEKRAEWVREKNMTVFSVVSDQLKGLTLDLFVENPYAYNDLQPDLMYEKVGGESIPTIDLARLISMKQKVARPQDLIDVQALQRIQAEHEHRVPDRTTEHLSGAGEETEEA